MVIGRDKPYFVVNNSDSNKKYSEDDICGMLDFLIDNIFVMFCARVFQQTVSIPAGTNYAPLPADLSLYSYEADFIQSFLQIKGEKLAYSYGFTFHYIDDVLSRNNSKLMLT